MPKKMGWVLTESGGSGAQRALALDALEKAESVDKDGVRVVCRGRSRTVTIDGKGVACTYREINDFS